MFCLSETNKKYWLFTKRECKRTSAARPKPRRMVGTGLVMLSSCSLLQAREMHNHGFSCLLLNVCLIDLDLLLAFEPKTILQVATCATPLQQFTHVCYTNLIGQSAKTHSLQQYHTKFKLIIHQYETSYAIFQLKCLRLNS